jgi:hypothetical protein
LTATTTDVGTLTIPILGELSLDPVEFGDATPLTGRPVTLESADWNIDPWFPEDTGPNTTTLDLSPIVQEIIGQNGWASGNSMAFIFKNDPLDSSERIAYSFDGDPQKAAVLEIDFTPNAVPEPSSYMFAWGLTLILGLRRKNRTPV